MGVRSVADVLFVTLLTALGYCVGGVFNFCCIPATINLELSVQRLLRRVLDRWSCLCVLVCLSPRTQKFGTYEVVFANYATPCRTPPTPPPCRRRTLITLSTFTKFELVWRRLCDDVLFGSPCLFERTICATRGSDWSSI